MNRNVPIYCADLESTGLLNDLALQGDAAKLHNFGAMNIEKKKVFVIHHDTFSEREKLDRFFDRDSILVMHNGIRYDQNALNFFGINTDKNYFVDTLALSWYLDLYRGKHGLDTYGEEAGIPKPKVDDWENLTQEEYDHRVTEDVRIQYYAYKKLKNRFEQIYGEMSDFDFCNHSVVKYLMFKMKQLNEQQEVKWAIDLEKAKSLVESLTEELGEKIEGLKGTMPKVPVISKHKKPAKPFKKDGSLSVTGERWKKLTEENGYPFNYEGEIEVIRSYDEPNPQSTIQIKEWLYSYGWNPQTFKYVKDDNGEERKIEQVYIPSSGGQICPSIEELAEKVPEVKHLTGVGVIKHRIGVIKGFIDSAVLDSNGVWAVEAGASGFTNTLRLKHSKPCVNLPSSRVLYGKETRSCLVAREGKILCGADLSSLENNIKFNLQLPYDREGVESQLAEDYDPHLEIAVEAGLLDKSEVDFYKIEKEGFPEENYEPTEKLKGLLNLDSISKRAEVGRISEVRGAGKSTNYACLPMDTQILTSQGLKYFNDVELGDTVYSYKDGKIVEDTVKYKHFYRNAEVAHFGDSKKTLRATRNHKWLVQKRVWDKATRKTTKELTDVSLIEMGDLKSSSMLLTTAPYVGGNSNITPDEAAFIAWVLADGSFNSSVTIAQSVGYFPSEVEGLLERLGLKYGCHVSLRDNGNHVNIYTCYIDGVRIIFNKAGLLLTKKQDFSSFILGLKKESLISFVDAFFKADGDVKNTNSYTIGQNTGLLCEAVRLSLFLLGDGRVKTEGDKKYRRVRRHVSKHISCQRKSVKKTTIEDVFCLTTENGSFVIVQDDEMLLTGNCQYNAGAATVARTAGVSLAKGKELVEAYRKLNWSIDVIAQSHEVKTVGHGKYQKNKFNGIWYPLKAEKDRFSTGVQGTGSYILDLWVANIFKLRETEDYDLGDYNIKLLATFHDEVIFELDEGYEEETKRLLLDALDNVNDTLGVEIKFGCDVQFGKNYSEIH